MVLNLTFLKSASSTGFRFFASFIALFLVFLVVSNLVLFRIFVPRFEAEISTLNELILRSTQIAFDERVFRPIETEYLEVALNNAGHDFYYPLSSDPAMNLWRPVESIAALHERVSSADFEPHSISIYFPDWGYVLSSQGFKFFDRSESILEFTWVDDVRTGPPARWSTVGSIVDYNKLPHVYEEMLLFVGPYPPAAVSAEPSAYIVIEVPIRRVREIVEQYADFSPGVFSIAFGDKTLYTNRDEATVDRGTDASTYVHSVAESGLSGLSYNYAIPREVLFRRSIEVRNGLYVLMVVTVLLSLVASWAIARYLGRPIREIARTAEQIAERLHLEPDSGDSNELVRIESTIEGLARRIERNIPLIQEKFFADLLNGVLADEEVERRVKTLDLGDLPSVVQVGILVQDTSSTAASEDPRVQIMQLLPGVESEFVLFHFPIDHARLALIAAANDEDQFTEFCYNLYDRLHAARSADRVRSGRHRPAFLSIGPPVDSLARVSVSFEAARRQIPLQFVSGNPVLTPVERNASDYARFEVPTEDRIGEVLASENPRTVADFIEGVRDEIRESVEDIDELNRKVCEFARRIKLFIRANRGYADEHLSDILDCDFSHFDVLGHLFQSWLDDINSYFSELVDGRHDSNSRLIQQARDYLDGHFTDDVSLAVLAERYGVSYSHLSKLFHDYSGLTFREYLLTLRLERASELLLSSNMPIKGVAYESGFRDTGYFIRQFKRKHGLTPVNYRKRGGGAEPG